MNTKNLIVAIVVVIIVVVGAYYISQTYYSAPAKNNKTNVPQTANSVSISNFSFNPASLTVKAGTTVTWTNNDPVTHTIKSSKFNSGNLTKSQTFQYTFKEKGIFDYSCGIHPTMMGKIIVE